MKVLISGAGIAGPTLAFWLRIYGFAPTLVESAPALRTSGYVIDFWGLGYDIAEKMGLLPDIARIGYKVQEVRIVDDRGRQLSGFAAQVFRERQELIHTAFDQDLLISDGPADHSFGLPEAVEVHRIHPFRPTDAPAAAASS